MTVLSLPRELDSVLGWCLACRGAGRFVRAVDAGVQACSAHLRLLPRRGVSVGQPALDVAAAVVPAVLRGEFAAGEQQDCTDCAAAGVPIPRQGLSGRTPGDPMPLCLPCWRSRTDRAARRSLSAEETGWLAELAEQLACEVCGRKTPPAAAEDLLPPDALEAKRRQVETQRHRSRRDKARGDRPQARRRSGCWRCEDTLWLASARAVYEADQAAAAADAARVDELRVGHEAALLVVERARRRLQTVQAWHERVGEVLKAMPRLVKTGGRGRLQVKKGAGARSRAWAATAEFLARDAAERQERGLGSLGRPSKVPLVVAAMAVAASFESGRGSMAGLHWTSVFAGVVERTVTTAWARTVQLGVTTRVMRGRILTLAEREQLGRHRQRAVYDFTGLHRSPVDRGPYLGAAAAVLAQLLARAVQLVDEHQALVDDAIAEAAAVQAELLDAQAWAAQQSARDLALQAEIDPGSWARQAREAAVEANAVRARATLAARPPVDVAARTAAQRAARDARQQAEQAVDNAFDLASRMATFCDHPRRGPGERSTSGCLFWGFTSARSTSPVAGSQRPDGRGEDHRGGASRPSPTKDMTRPTGSPRPRTVYGVHQGSPGRARRSGPASWAKELAAALAERMEFLQRYLDDAGRGGGDALAVARARGLRLCRIAATLASRLGPQWRQHPDDVVRLVERYAGVLSVIAPGDAHSPLAYLARMLDKALSNPAAVVPWPSPVRDRVSAATAAATHATTLAGAAALATALDARDTAAAADRTGPQHGLAAARAAAAAAGGRELPRPTPPGGPADAARMAAARAEIAQLAAGDWPAEAQPGSGLPDGWRRGDA